jgi:hypothetical protein
MSLKWVTRVLMLVLYLASFVVRGQAGTAAVRT